MKLAQTIFISIFIIWIKNEKLHLFIAIKYGAGFNYILHVYAVCVLKCAQHSRAATLLMGSVFSLISVATISFTSIPDIVSRRQQLNGELIAIPSVATCFALFCSLQLLVSCMKRVFDRTNAVSLLAHI
jgi:hypothetical protein